MVAGCREPQGDSVAPSAKAAFQEMATGHPAIHIGHAEMQVGPIDAQAAVAADHHAGPFTPLEGQAGKGEEQIGAGGEAERFELHGSLAGAGIGAPGWLAS